MLENENNADADDFSNTGMKTIQIPIEVDELRRFELEEGEILLITLPSVFEVSEEQTIDSPIMIIRKAFDELFPHNKIIVRTASINEPLIQVIHFKIRR